MGRAKVPMLPFRTFTLLLAVACASALFQPLPYHQFDYARLEQVPLNAAETKLDDIKHNPILPSDGSKTIYQALSTNAQYDLTACGVLPGF
jgi:hypothetical protein